MEGDDLFNSYSHISPLLYLLCFASGMHLCSFYVLVISFFLPSRLRSAFPGIYGRFPIIIIIVSLATVFVMLRLTHRCSPGSNTFFFFF
jgi:Na+-translocating ferredoxin:NAD+ oxidoreductase RnfE subunit